MTYDLAVKHMEATNREISAFSALVALYLASSFLTVLFSSESTISRQCVRYKGEFAWAVIQLGPSQASAIRNSGVSAFQGLKYTASIGNTIRAWRE